MKTTKKITKILAGGLIKLEITVEKFTNLGLGLTTRGIYATIYFKAIKDKKWFSSTGYTLIDKTFVWPIKKDNKDFVFSYGTYDSGLKIVKCKNKTDATKKANQWVNKEINKLKRKVASRK